VSVVRRARTRAEQFGSQERLPPSHDGWEAENEAYASFSTQEEFRRAQNFDVRRNLLVANVLKNSLLGELNDVKQFACFVGKKQALEGHLLRL
jgi:hypothetical protein